MKLVPYLFYACIFSLFFSCSHSNHVTSSSFIQKRKYNKGFHFSLIKKSNSADTRVESMVPDNQKNNDVLSYQKVELSNNSIEITELKTEITLQSLGSVESNNLILIEPIIPLRVALSKVNQPIQTVSQSLQKLRESTIDKNQNDQKSKNRLWLIGLIAIGVGMIMFIVGIELWSGGIAAFFGIGGVILAIAGVYMLIAGIIVRIVQGRKKRST